jgi:hypothetical protein
MALDSCILYKENIPQDMRPMTWLDYTIKIIEGLVNEWLQDNKYAAGWSGTAGICNTGDDCKYVTKLPEKKEKDCCVCNKRTEHGKGKRSSRTVCAKCNIGLQQTVLSRAPVF